MTFLNFNFLWRLAAEEVEDGGEGGDGEREMGGWEREGEGVKREREGGSLAHSFELSRGHRC